MTRVGISSYAFVKVGGKYRLVLSLSLSTINTNPCTLYHTAAAYSRCHLGGIKADAAEVPDRRLSRAPEITDVERERVAKWS